MYMGMYVGVRKKHLNSLNSKLCERMFTKFHWFEEHCLHGNWFNRGKQYLCCFSAFYRAMTTTFFILSYKQMFGMEYRYVEIYKRNIRSLLWNAVWPIVFFLSCFLFCRQPHWRTNTSKLKLLCDFYELSCLALFDCLSLFLRMNECFCKIHNKRLSKRCRFKLVKVSRDTAECWNETVSDWTILTNSESRSLYTCARHCRSIRRGVPWEFLQ